MIDPKTILDQFLGAKIPGTENSVRGTAQKAGNLAKDNPMATGLLAAVLLGTGTGRALTGSALRLGGLAAVAGLGYQAWNNYRNGRAPAESEVAPDAEHELLPPPLDSGFSPQASQIDDGFALALIRVMIGAAKADGHIDEQERARIHDKLMLSGIDADAVAFLEVELNKPIDIGEVVGAAKTEAEKVELYTAARLAIEPDSRAERGFLDLLAGRLDLDEGLVEHIEATVSAVKA